jgi:cellulose synthase (UDP-forming)
VGQPVIREDLDLVESGIPRDMWPTVDVFIVTYTEPREVVEGTLIAAVNLDYPEHLLTVHLLVRHRNVSCVHVSN